jgi:hypothetical protein
MLTQIKQVGMTYVTQPYLWYALAFFGLILVPNIIVSAGPRRGTADGAQPMLFVIGMPLLALVPMLVGQAKAQFGHARARLTPNFLPVHVIVAAGILLTLFVLYPLLESQIAGFAPLGVLALAAAIGAPALWGAHFNRFAPMLVSLVVFYSLLTTWGLDWWIINSSQHLAIHAAIFAAGILMGIVWLWRLSHLREEMDDYQNVYQLMMARRTGSEAVEQRRIVASQVRRNWLASSVGDWWHARIGGYYGGSPAGLMRLLRYGFGASPVEVQGLFFALMVLCLGIFFTQFSMLSQSGAMSGSFFFFAQFGILMPGQMAGEILAQRRPRIAAEMLLPVSRAQLVNGLLGVSARNAITLWLMVNIALGIVVAMTDEPPTLQTVAMFLLLSSATMLASMGVSLRTAVWPSLAKRLVALWLCWMVLFPPIMAWAVFREKIGDAPFVIIAGVFAGVGVWAIYLARRAWLNLEFA